MTAGALGESLVRQARQRLTLVDVSVASGFWPIAVREAQEVVELALKGLLRGAGVEPAKVHDVSRDLEESRDLLGLGEGVLERLASASRRLRREREAAFYGDVDLPAQSQYTEAQARHAYAEALFCVETAEAALRRFRGDG